MKHVYGPVASRRLGRSLGIDPVPLKTCNWNCVYCQLGRTSPYQIKRKTFYPVDDLLAELDEALRRLRPESVDYVTIVGSGETLLYAKLGELVHGIKQRCNFPVAVITNGSLLYCSDIRRELAEADVVLPSLDAASEEMYKKINRPHPSCTFDRQLEGLSALQNEFAGKIWIEVMLLRGLNDTEEALHGLVSVFELLKPDQVHLNVPARPPVEPWVQPPNEESLMRAIAILGKSVGVLHPAEDSALNPIYENVESAIVGITQRHPMTGEELERTLRRWAPGVIESALTELRESRRIQPVERYGTTFWCPVEGRFPAKIGS